MRLRHALSAAVLLGTLAGCQSQPPIEIYIVLSSTPSTANTTEIAPSATPPATETAFVEPPTDTYVPVTDTSAPATDTATQTATESAPSPAQPTGITPTALPANFPTPVVARIQVAEQLYEHGRMFWLEPTQEIWVLTITGTGHGTWSVYQDTWQAGVDPDSDPSLTPPSGLYQPVRGFGKLWRTVSGIRETLGWAATPEFGYLSDYQYVAGGSIDANGQYVGGPGHHVLYSLYGEQFCFFEADSTWQLGGC